MKVLLLVLISSLPIFSQTLPRRSLTASDEILFREFSKALVLEELRKIQLEVKDEAASEKYEICLAKIEMLKLSMLKIEIRSQEFFEMQASFKFSENHPRLLEEINKTQILKERLSAARK